MEKDLRTQYELMMFENLFYDGFRPLSVMKRQDVGSSYLPEFKEHKPVNTNGGNND